LPALPRPLRNVFGENRWLRRRRNCVPGMRSNHQIMEGTSHIHISPNPTTGLSVVCFDARCATSSAFACLPWPCVGSFLWVRPLPQRALPEVVLFCSSRRRYCGLVRLLVHAIDRSLNMVCSNQTSVSRLNAAERPEHSNWPWSCSCGYGMTTPPRKAFRDRVCQDERVILLVGAL
jgi:hypothetical protein